MLPLIVVALALVAASTALAAPAKYRKLFVFQQNLRTPYCPGRGSACVERLEDALQAARSDRDVIVLFGSDYKGVMYVGSASASDKVIKIRGYSPELDPEVDMRRVPTHGLASHDVPPHVHVQLQRGTSRVAFAQVGVDSRVVVTTTTNAPGVAATRERLLRTSTRSSEWYLDPYPLYSQLASRSSGGSGSALPVIIVAAVFAGVFVLAAIWYALVYGGDDTRRRRAIETSGGAARAPAAAAYASTAPVAGDGIGPRRRITVPLSKGVRY